MINSILANSKLVTKKVEKMANSIIKRPSFKERFTFETRQDEALRIMKKYPDRIPIIVERSSSDTTTELINKNSGHSNTKDIHELARKQGMLMMIEDGFIKAKNGITTIEEILRVTKE